jgi:hypothetical protein
MSKQKRFDLMAESGQQLVSSDGAGKLKSVSM